MAVKIRLTRMGAKKRPYYRVVIADSRYPRDGRIIESVGTYNPLEKEGGVTIKQDRVDYWLGQGAIPSDTVKKLLAKSAKSE